MDPAPAAPLPPSPNAPTRWSQVLRAADENSPETIEARSYLYTTYQPVLRSLVQQIQRDRGWVGIDPDDAVQGFFAEILSRGTLQAADPARGSFRHFLKATFKNYYLNQVRQARTQKRGGQVKVTSLDDDDEVESPDLTVVSPDRQFDLRWAEVTLTNAFKRLEAEAQAGGVAPRLLALRANLLTPGCELPADEELLAAGFATRGGAKTFLLRSRDRLQALFRNEVAQTLEDPRRVDTEMTYLLETLTQPGEWTRGLVPGPWTADSGKDHTGQAPERTE